MRSGNQPRGQRRGRPLDLLQKCQHPQGWCRFKSKFGITYIQLCNQYAVRVVNCLKDWPLVIYSTI